MDFNFAGSKARLCSILHLGPAKNLVSHQPFLFNLAGAQLDPYVRVKKPFLYVAVLCHQAQVDGRLMCLYAHMYCYLWELRKAVSAHAWFNRGLPKEIGPMSQVSLPAVCAECAGRKLDLLQECIAAKATRRRGQLAGVLKPTSATAPWPGFGACELPY